MGFSHRHRAWIFAVAIGASAGLWPAFAVAQQPATGNGQPPNNAQPANGELPEELKRLKDNALSAVRENETPRQDAIRSLLEKGDADPVARRVLAVDVLNPTVEAAIQRRILAPLIYYTGEGGLAAKLQAEYVPGLLLMALQDAQGDIAAQVHTVLRQFPREKSIPVLKQLLAAEGDLDLRARQLRFAAVAAMGNPAVFQLNEQISEFVPVLIAWLNRGSVDPQSDFALSVGKTLQDITQKRDIQPVTNGAAWAAWWDAEMKSKSEMQRVLAVYTLLRQNASRLQAELDELKLQDELRKVTGAKGNFSALLDYVSNARHPQVLVQALQFLREPVAQKSLTADQQAQLLDRLRPVLASPVPAVRRETAGLVIQLGETGEQLLLEQAKKEPVPDVRAAMLEEIGRSGKSSESLGLLLEVIKQFERNHLEVTQAALRAVGRWQNFATGANETDDAVKVTVEELRKIAEKIKYEENPRLAVALHNTLNALSDRVDITPVIRVILGPDKKHFSVQYQLVTVRQALTGRSAAQLGQWLRENERQTHVFRQLLLDPSRLPFEISTTLEILAALSDPFLQPEPDIQLYQSLARIHREPSQGDAKLPLAVENCFAEFAKAELAGVPAAQKPEFRVFDIMMHLEMSRVALEAVLPQLPAEAVNAHPIAIRRLRARLGVRVPGIMQTAVQAYGALVKEGNIPEAAQQTDVQWAFALATPAERAFRLTAAPRLVTALHPKGNAEIPAPVWATINATMREMAKAGPKPDGPRHVLTMARALHDWPDLKPILTVQGNQPINEFHAVIREAADELARWQAEQWAELEKTIDPEQSLPEMVRQFALNGAVAMAAVGTWLPAVPGNDAVVMPSLARKLKTLTYRQRATRDIWQLLLDVAAAQNKANIVSQPWPDEGDYEAARTELLRQLRSAGYPVE